MGSKNLISALLAFLLSAEILLAQNSVEKILPLDGRIEADSSAFELSWFDAIPPRVGSVTIKRRLYGQTGGETWRTIASELGPVMRFSDDTIKPGTAYEYQVLRTARDIVDVGYWVTGIDLPATAQRGNAYVIVDETLAEAIAPRLARFERDLIGDGWRVQRHLVPRHNTQSPYENLKTAQAVQDWLQERYVEDPFGRHTVVLIGHVPIVRSGKANPDGHTQVAHPTDLFYADMDGRWTALRTGVLLDNHIPGDFIEMQIGRIDFTNVSDGNRDLEIHLLQAYFDKNHHWRMGLIGDLRNAYGNAAHLSVELYGLRNIVGPEAIKVGGHHDVGEENPWLWGVDFGDRNGYIYAEKYANKAVFALNFGSGKQIIDGHFAPMTGLLAQPWYTLAVGWGARPAWWPHHMALGGTIGDVHMRTVNNGRAAKPYRESMDYYPTGDYLWRNPIWVNLLGDPTTRAFMLAPASELVAEDQGQQVQLTWQASPDRDVLGYKVYRAAAEGSTFTLLNDSAIVTGLSFIDPDPVENARYMVRAYGLKNVHAGSFHTFSQGTFTAVGETALRAADMQVSTAPGQSVTLPAVFDTVAEGIIHALVEGPAIGRLSYEGSGWRYTAPEGFTGTVPLRFSVSDRWHSDEGLLTITVGID